MRRMICWPTPDATCLEGGCDYCESDGESHTFTEIEAYAKQAGVIHNRAVGYQDALKAWNTGLDSGFFGRIKIRR